MDGNSNSEQFLLQYIQWYSRFSYSIALYYPDATK
jgi:hypothetical protein